MLRRKCFPKVSFVLLSLLFVCQSAVAQTDIHISGAQTGFPVAVPKLCDAGAAQAYATNIPEVIIKNLQISGLFNVISPASYVEDSGKCVDPNNVAFSDWSVIGAEGLVRGDIKMGGKDGRTLEVRMYLYDVLQQRAVIGKRYEASADDFARIAHKFSNEVMRYFTGEPGVFGTRIAYVSKVGRFKELFIMDMDGSNVRQLTRDNGLALSPSWSPSGDKIVYTSYRTRKPELWMVSPEGGAPWQITKREGLELGAEFSRDGSSLITSASVSGISSLMLFDIRGRLLRNVTGSSALDVSPGYSPDGQSIVFCSNRGGGPQIYVMPAAGGAARRISYAESNYCTSPAWSPKGDKIAFSCLAGGNQIFMVAPDGSQLVQLTFAGNNEDPAWSPDGRYVAYAMGGGRAGARNIAMVSMLNGQTQQISSSRSEDSQPAWSPRIE